MSYKIVRFFRDFPERNHTVRGKTGLTLEEAQAHCGDPETSSSTCTNHVARARTVRNGPWFDGYVEE